MFDTTSRYYLIETATITASDGRMVSYKRRRLLPRGSEMRTLTEVSIVEDERLDLIAERTLGDPEQFWRVCDANDALDPDDLTAELGRVVRVPIPEA